MKYYLAREGVAFGPYSEFQVRESVRLGIFQNSDLALAEDGKEWLEVSELLPPASAPRQPSPTLLAAAEVPAREGAPGEQPPAKLSAAPVSEYLLREHETYFADIPASSFGAELTRELTRGKIALAAVPVLVVMLGLLILAAMLRHREPSSRVDAPAHFSHHLPPVQTLVTTSPLLQPISLPLNQAAPAPSAAPAAPAMPASAPEEHAPAPEEHAAANPPPCRKIEGQMLLSANDGLSYVPRSVDVRLYPLSLLKPYLQKRSSEASARFEELKSQVATAESTKERLRKAADMAFDAYIQAGTDAPNRKALELASTEAKKAREAAANAYYHLMQDRENALSGAFYLEELPQTSELTQTDSEGKFSFEVPAGGEFAVVAGVQKNEEEAARHYYWFVPVNVEGEPKKEVLLSNNNLSSQGSAESLVQTVD